MGAKTDALATQIEGKAREAIATIQKLGDADWKKVTAAEKWTVGVTAHHLAGGLEAVAGIVSGLVVMAGALSITRQQRLYQSVMLKVPNSEKYPLSKMRIKWQGWLPRHCSM